MANVSDQTDTSDATTLYPLRAKAWLTRVVPEKASKTDSAAVCEASSKMCDISFGLDPAYLTPTVAASNVGVPVGKSS